MTPKQRAAIRRHGNNLLEIFPDATIRDPIALCKRLRRLEISVHGMAERMCNEDMGPNAPEEGPLAGTFARVELGLAKVLGKGSHRVKFNFDPRGYALKLDLKSGETLTTDWGGYGIIAPEIGPEGE